MLDGFCLDTSVFVNGWVKHYPPAVFPSLWEEIDKHIGHDRIWSCDEVYKELARQKDELFRWAKDRRPIFRKPKSDTIDRLRHIMAKFPNFAAVGGAVNRADPWVIAEAMVSKIIVVTYEVPVRQAPKKQTKPPKIPDVCEALKVPWTTPADFLDRLGISI